MLDTPLSQNRKVASMRSAGDAEHPHAGHRREIQNYDHDDIAFAETRQSLWRNRAWIGVRGEIGDAEQCGGGEDAEPRNALPHEDIGGKEHTLLTLTGADLVLLDHVSEHRGEEYALDD